MSYNKPKSILRILSMALVFAILSGGASFDTTWQSAFSDYQHHRFPLAINKLKTRLQADNSPNQIKEIHKLISFCYYYQGNKQQAQSYFTKALEIDKNIIVSNDEVFDLEAKMYYLKIKRQYKGIKTGSTSKGSYPLYRDSSGFQGTKIVPEGKALPKPPAGYAKTYDDSGSYPMAAGMNASSGEFGSNDTMAVLPPSEKNAYQSQDGRGKRSSQRTQQGRQTNAADNERPDVGKSSRPIATASLPKPETTLTIVSNVPDAMVSIDGILAGKTNEKLSVSPGSVEVLVERNGFKPEKKLLNVEQNKDVIFNINLSKPTPKPKLSAAKKQPPRSRSQAVRKGDSSSLFDTPKGTKRTPTKVSPRSPRNAVLRKKPKSRIFSQSKASSGSSLADEFDKQLETTTKQQNLQARNNPLGGMPAGVGQQSNHPLQFSSVPVYPTGGAAGYQFPAGGNQPIIIIQMPGSQPGGYGSPYAQMPPGGGLPPAPGPQFNGQPGAPPPPNSYDNKKYTGFKKEGNKNRRGKAQMSPSDHIIRLLPFGAGQFWNGQYIFGGILAASQLGALYYYYDMDKQANDTLTEANAVISARNEEQGNITDATERQAWEDQTAQFQADQQSVVDQQRTQSSYGLYGFFGLWAFGVVSSYMYGPEPASNKPKLSLNLPSPNHYALSYQYPLTAWGNPLDMQWSLIHDTRSNQSPPGLLMSINLAL